MALGTDCESEPGRRCLTVQVQGECIVMTEPLKVRHHIELKKCEVGKNPVISVANISEKKYALCLGIINDTFGIEIKPNGQRKMRKGGNGK